MTETLLQSIESFRDAAAEDRRKAKAFYSMLMDLPVGVTSERIELLAQYHQARAMVHEWCAEQSAKLATRGRAAS